MSGGHQEIDEPEIYRFPHFLDRLEERGALRAREAVESKTEVEGLVYHHRGLQVPAYTTIFYEEPDVAAGSAFRVEVGAVGDRAVSATFDRSYAWDAYAMFFDGGAVIAWMSDAEFEAEEAAEFESKAAAILAGRFSFGTVFVFGPEWMEREQWAKTSSAPALLQADTGDVIEAESAEEFTRYRPAIPPEFRPDAEEEPPGYLGLIDCSLESEQGEWRS